MNFWLEGEGPS